MTPKLRLSDADKNLSLSAIEKSCQPGNRRRGMSTHITEDPSMQAIKGQTSSTSRKATNYTNAADTCHNPSSRIIVEDHNEPFSGP
jgi:hypothetical protein